MKIKRTLALASALFFTSAKTEAAEQEKISLATGYTCWCTVKAGRTNELLTCTIFAETLEGRVGIHNLLFQIKLTERLAATELDFFLFTVEKEGGMTPVPTFSAWSDDKDRLALLLSEPVFLKPDKRYLQFSLQVASRTNSQGTCHMRFATGEFGNWPALPEYLREKHLPFAHSEKGDAEIVFVDASAREAHIEFYMPLWVLAQFVVTPGEFYAVQFSWDIAIWETIQTFKAESALQEVEMEIPRHAERGFIRIIPTEKQDR